LPALLRAHLEHNAAADRMPGPGLHQVAALEAVRDAVVRAIAVWIWAPTSNPGATVIYRCPSTVNGETGVDPRMTAWYLNNRMLDLLSDRVVADARWPARVVAGRAPSEGGRPAEGVGMPPASPPDFAKLEEVAAKYHIEMIGPPLEPKERR
jgi:hypothetical protein